MDVRFLEPERPYGLPEDVYNDVIPSGIHNYNRNGFLKPLNLQAPARSRKPRAGVFLQNAAR